MADISAFPTMHDVVYSGENLKPFTAGADIKAGQVVAFAAAGVSKTVVPAVHGTTGQPVGVAAYGVSSGQQVMVAGDGCWVKVANADNATAIGAGKPVEDNDNVVGGTVSLLPTAAAGTVQVLHNCIGFVIEEIPGNGVGIIEIATNPITQPNLS